MSRDRARSFLSEKHRALLDFWHARAEAGVPRRDHFTPEALRAFLGLLEIFDVDGGGRDFRYRLYGTRIAEKLGHDLTGKLLSDCPYDESRATAFDCYRQAVAHHAPAVMVAPLQTIEKPEVWTRVALPVARTGDGTPDQLLVYIESVPAGEVADLRALPLVAVLAEMRAGSGRGPDAGA